MKKIVLWLMSTVTAVVLLFGHHTSTSSAVSAAGGNTSLAAPATGGSGTASNGTRSTAGTSSSSTSSSGTSGSTGSTTVTGAVAETLRGEPVQVRLTVADGTITDVSLVRYPHSTGMDLLINARALPILVQDTLKAQSAKVDMISGATYTSIAYRTSLQSALDKAGL